MGRVGEERVKTYVFTKSYVLRMVMPQFHRKFSLKFVFISIDIESIFI
jgi:hypothetical protein